MAHFKHITAALKSTAMLATTLGLVATGSAIAGEGVKIFVVGGKPDDPFWSIVKRAAEDSASVVKAQGGSVTSSWQA